MMPRCLTGLGRMGWRFLGLPALGALLSCLACGEGETATPSGRATQGLVGSPEETHALAPSAFPTDLTRFEEDVEAFVDVPSCQAALSAALPSSVGDLLADLRYDHLGSDVCTGLAAASTEDATLCDGLATRTVQEGCRRRVATHLKRPELCAAREDDADSTCLAWASGRPGLCAGAPASERLLCEAVAGGDAAACEDATIPIPATCRALVQRHGPPSPVSASPLVRTFEASVELPSGPVDLEASVDRGLFVQREECRSSMTIEGTGSPRVNLRFDADGEGELRYFDGQTILGVAVEFRARDFEFAGELGGRIAGVVEVDVELDGHPRRVDVAFETFARNWLEPSECPRSTEE